MSYVYYNPNPCAKGQVKKWQRCDCTTRALCKFLGKSWTEIFDFQVQKAKEMYDMPNSPMVWKELFVDLGLQRSGNKQGCLKQTVASFAHANPEGKYILVVAKHLVCVEDGKYYDTFDCGRYGVYNAYYSEGTKAPIMCRTK